MVFQKSNKYRFQHGNKYGSLAFHIGREKVKLIDGKKYCSKCKRLLLLKDFNKSHVHSTIHRAECRNCQRKQVKKYCNSKEGKKTIVKYAKDYRYTPTGIWGKLNREGRRQISKEDFIEWYVSQTKVCVYCGISEKEIFEDVTTTVKRLTIDRKNNEEPYKKGNLALACSLCNSVKGSLFTYEEMQAIGKIITKKRKLCQ